MSVNNWEIIHKIDSDHKDIIHDLAYDFYGKRLATCSSDRFIRIWDKDPDWKPTCEWEAHNGSIWKLCWAHPEFGQIIASCGFDGQVFIWEEHERGNPFQIVSTVCKYEKPVVDVKFAPRHFGLKLATGWNDGYVRIYEAMDVMNLSNWSNMKDINVASKGNKGECECHLSWNPSPFNPPSFVVGTADGLLKVYQYTENGGNWNCTDLSISDKHSDTIHDVCWAPNLGRSYHLIASASKDKTVRIWKVIFEGGTWKGQVLASFSEHNSEVWRVQWNITGTILASSGDDGTVRIYQSDYQNSTWKCTREITADRK